MCGYTPFGACLFFAVGISFGNILFGNAFSIKLDASSNSCIMTMQQWITTITTLWTKCTSILSTENNRFTDYCYNFEQEYAANFITRFTKHTPIIDNNSEQDKAVVFILFYTKQQTYCHDNSVTSNKSRQWTSNCLHKTTDLSSSVDVLKSFYLSKSSSSSYVMW